MAEELFIASQWRCTLLLSHTPQLLAFVSPIRIQITTRSSPL